MFRYFLFNKPFQVLCQFSAEGDKKTLADFIASVPKDVYPVGRLDYDSEGLLLLTNDKALNHRLLNPAFAHQRTYLVQVEGMITEEAIEKLKAGVAINVDGKLYQTKPAVNCVMTEDPEIWERHPPVRFRKTVPDSWIKLTLIEGKNRQVRKMTAAVGFPTLRLVRYSIGKITVDGLEPGVFKETDAGIKDRLFSK